MRLRINENEVTNTYYGVFETGGSIGSHKEDDFYGRAGSKTGKLVKVFNNDIDAKEYAKRMRKSLSPGERKYYGYGYFTKLLTSKDMQNSVVQTMINNINESLNYKDNNWPAIDAARYYLDRDYSDEEVSKELDEEGYDDEYIQNVINWMNELFEEEPEEEFGSPYGHIW